MFARFRLVYRATILLHVGQGLAPAAFVWLWFNAIRLYALSFRERKRHKEMPYYFAGRSTKKLLRNIAMVAPPPLEKLHRRGTYTIRRRERTAVFRLLQWGHRIYRCLTPHNFENRAALSIDNVLVSYISFPLTVGRHRLWR